MKTIIAAFRRHPVATLFLATIASRIPFVSDQIFHTDSYGLSLGALFTWTAHPPGFIGYCALGRFTNYFLNDVNLAFVVVNIASIAAATALVYLLGHEMFDETTGFLAAGLFTTSVCAWYFSEVALTYAAEGFFATATAYTGWRALREKSFGWLALCTIVIAAGGSVRQTTLAFLFPLWCWIVWRAAASYRQRIAAVLILVVTVTAWMAPNAMNLRRHWVHGQTGFLRSVYDLQVRMGQYYDYTEMGSVSYSEPIARFHWPFVEIAVGVWNHVQPPGEDAPPEVRRASIQYALRAAAVQTLKLAFYIALSTGLVFAFIVLAIANRRIRREIGFPQAMPFLALWIGPPALFFAVGHFGSWGYLLIFLAGLSIIGARTVSAASSSPRTFRIVASLAIALNVGFFVFARPLTDTGRRNKLINVVLLQYDAPAIRAHFARARSSTFKDDPRQLPFDCVTDDCLKRDLPGLYGLDPDVHPMNPIFSVH